MNTIAIIQARMGSSRLPDKVMLELAGESMLTRVVNRSQRAALVNEVVVATTTKPVDKAIVQICAQRSWHYFKGSEEDVLDRYYRAAEQYQADVVVRITADCPLIDPEIVDLVVREFVKDGRLDFASNTLPPRTFPRGLDVEVIAFDALECAWCEDDNRAWREHVTPYIYRHPEKFALKAVANAVDYSSMRWAVDTAEDVAFVRKIYEHFGHDGFSWIEVLTVLENYPEWLEINRHVVQKEVG